MAQLRGVIVTGMPASGKSAVVDYLKSLAIKDGRLPGVLSDRKFIQKTLLRENDNYTGISEVAIEGEGTLYFFPSEGKVELSDGGLALSNGEITSFSLNNPSLFNESRIDMFRRLDDYPPFTNTFFIIEFATAENVKFESGIPWHQNSENLYNILKYTKLGGKPLTDSLAVLELTADDKVRAERNAARKDGLPPDVWKFYEKNGGSMPEERRKDLLFEQIHNNGTEDELKAHIKAAYENFKEQYLNRSREQRGRG